MNPYAGANVVCEPWRTLQGGKGPLLGNHKGEAQLPAVGETIGQRQVGFVTLLLSGDDYEPAVVCEACEPAGPTAHPTRRNTRVRRTTRCDRAVETSY